MLEDETGLAAETGRAMRELARTVSDAPPLRLAPGRAGRAPRPAGQRRWTLWAVPLTAAVAVIALAVALVTIKDLPNGRVAPPTAPASSSAAGLPAYYAAPETFCKGCQSTRLVVGDTSTGAKLATFSPPRGTTFEAVSAAADDRTFVADAVDYPFGVNQHSRWFLVKITPGAPTPVRLTQLRIPAMPLATSIGTVALSPSGREVAVTYMFRDLTPRKIVLGIYSVATGKLLDSWSTTNFDVALGAFDFAPYAETNNQLSWIDGGRALSFTTISDTYLHGDPEHVVVHAALRTLNVTAGGGDLIRDSRVIWSTQTPDPASVCTNDEQVPWLTANGKTIVCDTDVNLFLYAGQSSGKREAFPLSWVAFEISEPKVARTLYKFTAYTTGSHPVAVSSVQWANASGSTIIVAWLTESTTGSSTHFGEISNGRYTPLPVPPGISLGTPPDVAW